MKYRASQEAISHFTTLKLYKTPAKAFTPPAEKKERAQGGLSSKK